MMLSPTYLEAVNAETAAVSNLIWKHVYLRCKSPILSGNPLYIRSIQLNSHPTEIYFGRISICPYMVVLYIILFSLYTREAVFVPSIIRCYQFCA